MAERVVVQNVDELEAFRKQLMSKKEDIEKSADELMRACYAQSSNWEDPQYESLKKNLETFVRSIKSTTASLDDSSAYIARLVAHLRNLGA